MCRKETIMSQYVELFFDDEEKYYYNTGLYDIIVYLGSHYYTGKSELSEEELFNYGKKVINSKANKRHKTAINRLVKANVYKYNYNCCNKEIRPQWKIHRKKSRRVFSIIYRLLLKCNEKTVLDAFIKICSDYGFTTSADAIGSPYYSKISNKSYLKSNGYNDDEIMDLVKCSEAIERFLNYRV